MTLTKYGLVYSRCTSPELNRFIHQRGIDEPIPDRCDDRGRRRMIRNLRKADSEATFRFLDLPPEIRNQVYEYVLEVDDFEGPYENGRHVDKQQEILLTCRQAYTEASGLLYGKFHFPLRLSLGRGVSPYSLQLAVVLNGHTVYKDVAMYELAKPVVDWPSIFNRIHCLNITIELGQQTTHQLGIPYRDFQAECTAHVNEVLHQLHKMLGSRNDLRSIRVHVLSHVQLVDKYVENVLSPLPIIASKFKNSEFSFVNISDSLQSNILQATVGFRKLRANEDVKEALICEWSSELGEKAARAKVQRTCCTIVDDVMTPIKMNGMSVYSNDVLLKRTISWYEALLQGTIESEITRDTSDDLRSALVTALKRLKA